MAGKALRYVVRHGDGWAVKGPGASKASQVLPTLQAAKARAHEIVTNLGGGEVRVHRAAANRHAGAKMIVTPATSGVPIAVPDDSVIVPREEWERVSAVAARAESFDEDASDLRAGERALARIKAGQSEFFPLELAKRISNGESPVRAFREYRGISGAELARRVGLDQSTISNIETGKTHGTLTTMSRIARALGVGLGNLVPADLTDA